MKKLKLCLLVSITLFLSMTIQSIVFAEETSRDITTLSALGIIEGEFAPEDNLTRYELASMVVRCAKYEKKVWTKEEIIKVATDYGFVPNFSDGKFEENYYATGSEVNNAFMKLIGLDDNESSKKIASQFYPSSLLFVDNVYVTHKDVARNLQKLLDTNALSISFGGHGINYEISQDKTLLNGLLNIKRVKGRMTANTVTAIMGDTNGNKSIKIDSTSYTVESNDYNDFIGMNVVAYISDYDGDDPEAIYVYAGNNDIVEFSARDITGKSTADKYVIELDNGKNKTYRVSEEAEYIYNGVLNNDLTASEIMPSKGQITLLDNNSDGLYDIVKIISIRDIVVSSVNIDEQKINGKQGLTVELKDCDTIVINSEENIKNINEIKKNDVVSLAMSKDKRYAELYVVRGYIEGSVDRIDDEHVVINGVEYTFDIPLEHGVTGNFYQNVYGDIIYFDSKISDDISYGLIYRFAINEGDDSVTCEIFNETGEFETFELAKTVRVDGNPYKGDNQKNIKDDIMGTGVNGTYVQLVRYALNSEGKLKMIDTEKADEEKNSLKLEYEDSKIATIQDYLHIPGVGWFDYETRVFAISTDMLRDKTSYVATSYTMLQTIGEFNGKVYDLNERYTPRAVLVFKGTDAPSRSIAIMVDKVWKGLNEDDEVVQIMRAYSSKGTAIELVGASADVFNGLKRGDIITYGTNSKMQVTVAKKWVDINNISQTFANAEDGTGRYHSQYREFLGVITEIGERKRVKAGIIGDDGKIVTTGYKREATYALVDSRTDDDLAIVVYDMNEDKIYVADESVLDDVLYSKNPKARLFLKMSYSWVSAEFLYK